MLPTVTTTTMTMYAELTIEDPEDTPTVCSLSSLEDRHIILALNGPLIADLITLVNIGAPLGPMHGTSTSMAKGFTESVIATPVLVLALYLEEVVEMLALILLKFSTFEFPMNE
eukprot:TRINITY_DN17370_c0_g2_i2.p2 TRINITY_DN17370_c0_g2~~TRINITY_DN17370_c0_g2_i2.p2  ORF type:complete len:114 (+),score=1.39 TRINITY_DN17370_c0_g2_i2:110-451(+)